MIDLPTWPQPASATPIYLDKGGILPGGGGASDQRLNKLGDRWGLSVTMPPMESPKVGRQWVSRLVQAKREGGRISWPLQGFDPGAPGDIRVNGIGQAGSTLVVDGATPNYVAREGQFFSIITNGARFVYMVKTETIFNDLGQANVPITPPLRFEHLDNDVCEFGAPIIEGFIQGDQWQWDWAVKNLTMPLQFEIHERA